MTNRSASIAYVLAFAASGCDPHNEITVRFAVHPGDNTRTTASVSAYWVKTYEGRSYAEWFVSREVSEPEFGVTTAECCGTAADYRSGELWFLGCVARPGADPTLVCGKVGAPEAELVRSIVHGTTCAAIDKTIGHMDVDLKTCSLSPTR